MKCSKIRVAITGAGVVSPIGIGMEEFAAALFEGKQVLSELDEMPVPRGKNQAGRVKESSFNGPNRGFLMAKKAIREGLESSGMALEDGEEVGLILSTINGDSGTLENMYSEFTQAEKGNKELLDAICLYPNGSLLNALGKTFGLNGPRMVVSNACASGNISLGLALDMIREGKCKKVIVAGLEVLKPSMVWGAERAGFIGTHLRPFDKERNGSILGEGAGVLILEAEDIINAREPLGWLDGFGCACDRGAAAITLLEDGSGLYRSMKQALDDSNRVSQELEYVNAHAPGTPLIDRVECDAIAQLCVDNEKEVFVNSTKSMTAHLSGASAIVEAIAILIQMNKGYLHANVNLKNLDTSLALNPLGSERLDKKVDMGISNACGGGGLNTSVLISAPKTDKIPSDRDKTTLNRELFITGIGSISTLGADCSRLDSSHDSDQKREYLDWFDIHQWYEKDTNYSYYNRAAQLAAAAAAISWENTFVDCENKDYDDDKIAVIAGTFLGGGPEASQVLCERLVTNPKSILPSMSLDHGLHLGSALVSRQYGLTGWTCTLTGTITSGIQAIITACNTIKSNRADAAMALSYDALDRPLRHALSFLNGHAGTFPIGEGSAALFIEDGTRAMSRNNTRLTAIGDTISLSGSFKNSDTICQLAERLNRQLTHRDWEVLYIAAAGNKQIDMLADQLISLVGNEAKIKRLQPVLNHCLSADAMFAVIASIYRGEHAMVLSADLSGSVAAITLKTQSKTN